MPFTLLSFWKKKQSTSKDNKIQANIIATNVNNSPKR